jgi:hypothetical protein
LSEFEKGPSFLGKTTLSPFFTVIALASFTSFWHGISNSTVALGLSYFSVPGSRVTNTTTVMSEHDFICNTGEGGTW